MTSKVALSEIIDEHEIAARGGASNSADRGPDVKGPGLGDNSGQMPLTVGTRLGSYEIQELIGVGGMGEVYRARDAKLHREVALKTLPSAVALDDDRLLRLRREAQLLAALNHTNIAGIYGLEEAAGVQALVLELIEGPTLADRIAQGPIPFDQAQLIAVQIANALEAAHTRGIIHRDLKPANIKVRPDGSVKVLDFGLAKAVSNDGGSAEASASPTITSPALTRLGVILGTAAYMSPEQARGREADARSDIWAFGCVLFEMLSGARPFDGSEVTDTLAGILKSDPDWTALPSGTPSGIRRLLRRCLQKDPRARYHAIADVRLDLEDASAPDATPVVDDVRPDRRFRQGVAWSLAGLSIAALAAYAVYGARQAPTTEITRFQVYPPADMAFDNQLGAASTATVSPDGTRLVFVAADREGRSLLWIRPFDSFEALPLAGTAGASSPFWSPDGRRLAFFAAGKLKQIDAGGGTPQTICDVDSIPRGGTWGIGGEIVYSSGGAARLYRVPDQGGRPMPLPTGPDQSISDPSGPEFLPDGRSFLFWSRHAKEGGGVYARRLETDATATRLLAADSQASYDPSGFLLFMRDAVLLRQRFDPERMEATGEPAPVAEGVRSLYVTGRGLFSVSRNGVLVFQPDTDLTAQFAWVDRAGRVIEKVGAPGKYLFPQLSPDGKRLAYVEGDGNIWVRDLNRQISSKITSNGNAVAPVWSNDGRTLFYRRGADEKGPTGIYQTSASGGTDEKLFFEGRVNGPSQVSSDGRWLLYFAAPEGESVHDVYVLPMEGDRAPRRLVQSPNSDVEPQLSPDGKLLAYASSRAGRLEVFVQPVPPNGEQWQVSTGGGRQPQWRQDGKELFFVSGVDKKFYAVSVKPGPTLDFEAPQFLFEMRAHVINVRNSYVPSPDGNRFLVNMTLDDTRSPIHVVRNWTAGIKH